MESERIDWKAFAQQFRENHISQESARELRYQNEMFNFSRILEDLDHENYWKREDVGQYYTIFGALEEYWSFNVPIPPELIDTILHLYRKVYLGGKGKVTLEKAFFDQPGRHKYVSKYNAGIKESFRRSISLLSKVTGRTQIELSEEYVERHNLSQDARTLTRYLQRKNSEAD
jgi:hypothetical protein|tara:strand:- start:346 stop:864 length:519 start_codon:yes stop_codon:yes gene_type:complete